MTCSQPKCPEKKKKKGDLPPSQTVPLQDKVHRLPHKDNKTSSNVLQFRDVAAAEGDTKVTCEVPQPRIHTREKH
jgi:hypothetical protein